MSENPEQPNRFSGEPENGHGEHPGAHGEQPGTHGEQPRDGQPGMRGEHPDEPGTPVGQQHAEAPSGTDAQPSGSESAASGDQPAGHAQESHQSGSAQPGGSDSATAKPASGNSDRPNFGSFGREDAENNRSEQQDAWKDMLSTIFNDATAQEITDALAAQGIDPTKNLDSVLSGKNFTLITQQIQNMLGSSGEGPVNWKIAEQVARENITTNHLDRLSAADGDAARDALRTASLWLDAATEFYPAKSSGLAWNRLDFVAHALPTFRRLLEPVGANISRAFYESFTAQLENMPPEMRGMFGDPTKFMGKMTATMIGVQYGTGLAELAAHSFGSTDTGLPLMEGSRTALVPANVADFAQELEVPADEVMLYVAARESAAARLYNRVPWLRARVLDTVAAFAREIAIDTDAIESQLRDSLQSQSPITALDLSSVCTLELSGQQQELLGRLEHVLSLAEGWVAHVSSLAIAPHLPHAIALQEMFIRRYATDNPAKAVWEKQLGMQLAPKSLRAATAFWQLAYTKLGAAQRDGLWAHPDLLPTPEALADPDTFFAAKQPSKIEAELDSFLEELLNEADQQGDDQPGDTDQPDAADE